MFHKLSQVSMNGRSLSCAPGQSREAFARRPMSSVAVGSKCSDKLKDDI
ncbi:MAG: hypothetical protein Q4F00_08940 [bacterium]|nr:hypothetical protein [bacterium]